MNKIEKFLRKLDRKRREAVEFKMRLIIANDLGNLDMTKLGGRENEYRVRIGTVRIQFRVTSLGNFITKVGFKNESTY